MAKGLSGWRRSIWPGQIGGEVAARQTAGEAWQLAKASRARVAWGKGQSGQCGGRARVLGPLGRPGGAPGPLLRRRRRTAPSREDGELGTCL